MADRGNQQVERLLRANREVRESQGTPGRGRANAVFSGAVRNSRKEEFDAFVDESLDEALGPDWR